MTQNVSENEKIFHTGMLAIGTYDNFTCRNPVDFLENINKHFRTKNELFFYRKNVLKDKMEKSSDLRVVVFESANEDFFMNGRIGLNDL